METRVEAFLEEIAAAKRSERTRGPKKMESIRVLGIDSGSTSTNAVIIDEDENIVAWDVIRTGAGSRNSSDMIIERILAKADIGAADITTVVSTGYGRGGIKDADKNITEISCHGRGAHFLEPDVRTILDIGGQDSKAIRLSSKGDVVDFAMNDKCAAGTGRFLEMMADTLEVGIDELGDLSLGWKNDITMSSMCSVFAESEVISLIAENKDKADIAHGVHKAICTRAMSLLRKVGIKGGVMMSGGVAKNKGVVRVLEEMLGEKVFVYEQPEIVGALGAALLGLESLC